MRIFNTTMMLCGWCALVACGPTQPTGNSNNDNGNGNTTQCGNQELNTGESCDGALLDGETCLSLTGHTEGQLLCSTACTFDLSACHTCGNGEVEGFEQCDGVNLSGLDCNGIGREDGVLGCLPDCSSFDLSNCGDCFLSDRACSADLQHVVDCNGQVVESCLGDVACQNGHCDAEPCEAAEAAKSSYGCEYYAVKPDVISAAKGACFAVYIANTWPSPVFIDVERGGVPFADQSFIQIPQGQGQSITYTAYDPAMGLPAGEVAILFLSHETPQPASVNPCPLPAAMNAESGVLGNGLGQAFRITTDKPVVAYSILPYGGGSAAATSATLLLPTSAWDTNYIAVNAYAKSVVVADALPSMDIVAYEDQTEVTLLPGVTLVGGNGVPSGPANTPVTIMLQAGQYVQISQAEELTGSPIQADKPIGLWAGASCLNVLVSTTACDSAHQQIPPVRALGSRYVGVRYRNRANAAGEETPPWRLVGAVDGTQLVWTPSAPVGAPLSLEQGQMAEFEASGPFAVESQDASHPFYFAQYMTGGAAFGGEGDPEFVNIVPSDQYLNRYVFFTDPTYSETSLVVVRSRSEVDGTFADVDLDCAGVLTGWQPVGDFEYTRIDLVTGDFQNVGNCSNGRHEITSDLPFAVTVWGWGGFSTFFTQYVSYAYPAGASIKPINDVVVVPVD